jgi:hypothetical protein
MPFTKTQSVLKKILPEKQFDSLYGAACNWYDIYAKVRDYTFCIPSYLWYKLSGNKDAARRIEIVQKVLSHTMVSRLGVLATYDTVMRASKEVDGAFVECGVARGGCSAVMALIAQDENKGRKTWMFDSFEGLPAQTNKDGKQKPIRHKNRKANDLAEGYCLGTFDEVGIWIFGRLRLKDVVMIKGWFQDTLPKRKNEVGSIAVLRLDGDWFESTKCCLENLYDNVVSGGYVIIDDLQLLGCKKAVDEYIVDHGLKVNIITDANGRGYWRKS